MGRFCFQLFILVFLIAGCTTKQVTPPSGEIAPQSPLGLDVVTAEEKDGVLNLSIALKARTVVDSSQVIITAKALREGVVVAERYKPLAEVTAGRELKTGESINVDLAIPGSGFTDYQLSCSWGQEGRALLARTKAEVRGEEKPAQSGSANNSATSATQPEAQPALRLTNLNYEKKSEPCGHSNCDERYTISGEISNGLQRDVGDITFALRLRFVANNETTQLPTEDLKPLAIDEEEIKLGAITVSAGSRKRFKITVDRPLPVLPSGRFVPELRLLKFR